MPCNIIGYCADCCNSDRFYLRKFLVQSGIHKFNGSDFFSNNNEERLMILAKEYHPLPTEEYIKYFSNCQCFSGIINSESIVLKCEDERLVVNVDGEIYPIILKNNNITQVLMSSSCYANQAAFPTETTELNSRYAYFKDNYINCLIIDASSVPICDVNHLCSGTSNTLYCSIVPEIPSWCCFDEFSFPLHWNGERHYVSLNDIGSLNQILRTDYNLQSYTSGCIRFEFFDNLSDLRIISNFLEIFTPYPVDSWCSPFFVEYNNVDIQTFVSGSCGLCSGTVSIFITE